MRVPAMTRASSGGPLVALAMAYLAGITAIMIWRGISVSPDYLLLLLVPVALLSGRLVGYLRDWVPFVALFLAYEAMRGVAGHTGIPAQVQAPADLEQWVFGGTLPTVQVQHLVAWAGLSGPSDLAATVVYFCHFAVPVGIGMALWLVDRPAFLRFTTALLGMSFVAFIIYLLAPTAPPWWAQDHGVVGGFRHVMSTSLPSAVSPYYRSLNPNPTAALPSLHAAYPFLGYLALRRTSRLGGGLALGWCVLVWTSVVYLGEHYVVDVIAGVALATAAWAVVTRLVAPRVSALAPAQIELTGHAQRRPQEESAAA